MRRRLLVSCVTLVVVFALVESAVRVRQYVRFGTTSQSYHDLEEHTASGLMVPKANAETGSIRVNPEGFRSPSIPLDKPAGTVRLAFLGGSTTFCAEVSSNAATWPHLVTEELRRTHPDVSFDYLNAAAAGYTTADSLLNMRHRVAAYAPDVVVVYHGTNDLVHLSRLAAIEVGLFDLESDVETDTWLSRNCMTWFLLKKNLRNRGRQARAAENTQAMPIAPGDIAVPFRGRLVPLLDEVAKTASLICLPTFATKVRTGQAQEAQMSAASSAIYYMPFFGTEEILAGYQQINSTLREVAQGRDDVLLIEGEGSIPADEEHFADTVHFLDAGSQLQAQRVVGSLESSPKFAALLESASGN
ncbi:MAG: hypothetical protein ACI8QS_001394 [Planctomycetota bacterium]|jgi:hypothetical protein